MNEKLKIYDEKMQKNHPCTGYRACFYPCRTCKPEYSEQINGRILWNTDTNPAGSKRIRTGSTYDSDPAMGKEKW